MTDWKGLSIDTTELGISAPLSEQMNLLGELLGHSVRQHMGEPIFKHVEELRRLCIDAYGKNAEKKRARVQKLIEKMDLEEITAVLRVFTTLFHLINGAEKQEITRINREREKEGTTSKPRSESIPEAIQQLKSGGYSLAEVMELVGELDIQPTLTAHPTEARRRSILVKQESINNQLEKLRYHDLTPVEYEEAIAEIYTQISLLLTTSAIRADRLTVPEEVQQGLYFFSSTIWDTIPQMHQEMTKAIKTYYGQDVELPVFLKYRSWIGGDRDGNPFVTTNVTRDTLQSHRITALRRYLHDLDVLRRQLSLSSQLVKIPEALYQSLDAEAAVLALPEELNRRYRLEPFRLRISYMIERIAILLAQEGVQDGNPFNQNVQISYDSDDFIADLKMIRTWLQESSLGAIAGMASLERLLIQARTFGFHIAAIDIRQHSEVHERAVAELFSLAGVTDEYMNMTERERLELLTNELGNPRPLIPVRANVSDETSTTLSSFKLIRKALRKDPKSIGCYIISMTHEVTDFLEVLLLAKETGLWRMSNGQVVSHINVVPLLETIDDLRQSEIMLDQVFSHRIYQRHLAARNQFQEVMLGYSDSNKDGGYWMANWALYQGQEKIARACRKHNLQFRLFHGRGGTVGRGGGRANSAILALPPESYTGKIRFTEQGEIITFRYAFPAIAHRHLEQIVNAMLSAALHIKKGAAPSLITAGSKAESIMEEIATASMQTYQELIQNKSFWKWYIRITPIEHISHLPIASRPVSRKSANEVDFEGLRAIPWVFAWTQTRYNIPGWYGAGAGLHALLENKPESLKQLQEWYKNWAFFRTVVDNAQLELKRTHLPIAAFYDEHSEIDMHSTILADFDKAVASICKITSQKEILDNAGVLKRSIALRNPYTDVLNLLQVGLLGRWRDCPQAERDTYARALFLSINGVAAAMQSTG